jgi:SPP1 family predicted phage head-tail adaptor
MRVGQLDRRIYIQTATTVTDDWNHPTISHNTAAVVWANKQERNSVEVTESMQEVNVTRVIWTIRYRTDIDGLDRLTEDGTNFYHVTGTQELGRGEWLRIFTEVRDNKR